MISELTSLIFKDELLHDLAVTMLKIILMEVLLTLCIIYIFHSEHSVEAF